MSKRVCFIGDQTAFFNYAKQQIENEERKWLIMDGDDWIESDPFPSRNHVLIDPFGNNKVEIWYWRGEEGQIAAKGEGKFDRQPIKF